jgi:hypothetical protein
MGIGSPASLFLGFILTGCRKDTQDDETSVDVDVVRAEMVESELDCMIDRRNDQRREAEGHRPSEEMYEESCRAHKAKREQERRAAWCRYHEDQAIRHRATLEALIGHHQAEAEKYTENDGHHHYEEDS